MSTSCMRTMNAKNLLMEVMRLDQEEDQVVVVFKEYNGLGRNLKMIHG